MPCVVQRRAEAQEVADAAADCTGVAAAEAVLRTDGELTGWTVEIECAEPIPVELHQALEEQGFGVARAAPRGDHLHVIAA